MFEAFKNEELKCFACRDPRGRHLIAKSAKKLLTEWYAMKESGFTFGQYFLCEKHRNNDEASYWLGFLHGAEMHELL